MKRMIQFKSPIKLHNLYEEALVDTLSLLDKQQLTTIASLIHSANVVDIYTHAHNLNVANNFQVQLLSLGKLANQF